MKMSLADVSSSNVGTEFENEILLGIQRTFYLAQSLIRCSYQRAPVLEWGGLVI
jgi:hypothetical protein